jgi:hypothetical protein
MTALPTRAVARGMDGFLNDAFLLAQGTGAFPPARVRLDAGLRPMLPVTMSSRTNVKCGQVSVKLGKICRSLAFEHYEWPP